MLDDIEEAFFSIERDSGEILSCNVAAANLLGSQVESLRGTLWTRALGCEADSAGILNHAAEAGVRVSLPPLVIQRMGGEEMVVGGMLLPGSRDQASLDLLLWRLPGEAGLGFTETISPSDILAVLGVDQLHYGEHWGTAQTAQLMTQVRTDVTEIVRTQDAVGSPCAAALIIVLRDVDISEAQDICRALLSHLNRIHIQPGSLLADTRFCVGLARKEDGSSALATLLAANNALRLTQSSGAHDPVRIANPAADSGLLAGQLVTAVGVFSGQFTATQPGQALENVLESPPDRQVGPAIAPIEKDILGYVVDNMEGAVDQAIFLAGLDVPIAIVGPAGTGKMYIAKIIHDQSSAMADMLVAIDCREFRSVRSANTGIARELAQGEGKTLVFKSPHLMSADAQLKLARQISSRTLADVSPPRYLPRSKLIALFPEPMEVLLARGELTDQLASVFAGYPINVPPIKDRKQAVLRWAHKILGQEGALRDRDMKGFTPDAEHAMLLYDWPGNISEMRQCIFDALERTSKDWLTPVDLGLFKGINPDGAPYLPEPEAFLSIAQSDDSLGDAYVPSALENLDIALGEAVHSLLALGLVKPLGTWMEDDLVLSTLDRYRQDLPRTADFLHTKSRNVSRWLPKIHSREEERNNSSLWQTPRRHIREWVRESARLQDSPLLLMEDKLMAHIEKQAGALSTAKRARIMGVSTPTYMKRQRQLQDG